MNDRMLPLTRDALSGVRGVVFDVDDTLTEHGTLRARSLDALERLTAAGFVVGIATGRPLGFAELALRQWPIDFAVGENGAGWFVRATRGVAFARFDPDAATTEARRAEALAIGRTVAPDIVVADDAWARRIDVAWDVGEHHVANEDDVSRLGDALRTASFHVVRSSIHLHAAHGAWDKPKGIVRALSPRFTEAEVLGTFAYVGDSDNDSAAFAAFERSIGVANAREHTLSTSPRYVTRNARSLGVTEVAEALLA